MDEDSIGLLYTSFTMLPVFFCRPVKQNSQIKKKFTVIIIVIY